MAWSLSCFQWSAARITRRTMTNPSAKTPARRWNGVSPVAQAAGRPRISQTSVRGSNAPRSRRLRAAFITHLVRTVQFVCPALKSLDLSQAQFGLIARNQHAGRFSMEIQVRRAFAAGLAWFCVVAG